MRKLFTFLLTMVVTLVANAAIEPTVVLGDEFTSVAALDGKFFAIVDKTAEKALYGSNAQNLAYDTYANAFQSSNSGYMWQLESLADNADASVRGYYLLHLVAPNGTPVPTSDQGGKYLNSQNATGWCSFVLGLTAHKLGQDIDYGAVWDVQYVEGQGFSLKNIGTGLYKGVDTGTANKEAAAYFTFAPVSITYVPALEALLAEGEAMKAHGASSAEYDAAIAGIDPKTTTDALADAKKVEAALAGLAMTQTKSGADFTRAIANFDCGAKTGWTFDKPKGGNGPDHGGDFEYWAGNANPRNQASFDYWQEVTGLPNGKYTVSAEIYNSLNNEGGVEFKPTVGVYATVGETTVSKLVDVNSEKRVPYVTDEIEVTDGKIRIGVKSFETPIAARWVTMDNFKLTLVEAAKAPAPEKEKWFTDNTFCYKDAANNVSRSMELPWVADPDDPTNGCIKLSSAAGASADHDLQFMIRGAEYDGADLTKGAFAEGVGFKVTFKVKADGNYSGCPFGTFYSTAATGKDGWKFSKYPGDKLDVTTEWQTVSFSYVATADDAGKLTAVGFNLAEKSGSARTFYIDDVEIARGASDWSFAMKYTDKYKPEGKDQNKPAAYVADGDYLEVKTLANPVDPWDNQFFIQIADAAPEGKFSMNDKVKLTFKVMAIPENTALEKITCDGQFHRSPDGAGYIGNIDGGNVEITEMNKWIDVEKTLEIKNLAATQYCLNLSKDPASITYRFKDITAEYTRGMDDWYTGNVIVAKDPAVEYVDGTAYEFPAAPYVYDASGNGYAEVKTMANPSKEWASQIFFTVPEKLAGKPVTISMKVKGSKAVTAKAQRHMDNSGSKYMDNYADANIDFTTEWKKVSVIVDTKKVNGEVADTARCFVLNLAVDAEALTFDFDSLKFEQYFAPVDYGKLIEIPLEGTVVKERDFTKETSYTHSPGWASNKDGYTDQLIVGEGLEIVNNADQGMWDSQFFIMEGFDLVGGRDYAVRYTLKYEGDGGNMQINMGDWTNNDQGVETLAAGPIYTHMVRLFPSFKGDAKDAHVFFQSGAIKGRMIVEKVEVLDITPKYDEMEWTDNLFTNGDVEGTDMSAFIAKVNSDKDALLLPAKSQAIKGSTQVVVETAAREADPDNEGKYLGNDHDTQFFVRLPYALPKGTLYYFSVDYLATKVADVASQTHAEPGEWKSNNGVGTISTSSTAQTLEGYFSAADDMRSIAFNLASAVEGGKFFFDNFVFKVVKDNEAAIKTFTEEWDKTSLWDATFALNNAVDKGRTTETEGKGYTDESVKALTDAIAAGKAQLFPAEGADPVTAETLAAATKAIEDAIAGLEKGKPELAYTDLTKEMFFHWNAADETAEALEASNCDYNIGTSTGQPYGLSTVNHDRFADLSAYNTIELTATEGEPRLLFNRIENEGTVFAEVPRDKDKYETVVDNGDGSKTYVIDIAAIVAEYGFAHLHAIKGANWANTTVTEIKLGYAGEKPELPIPTAIEGVETEGESIADGKYIENGQIVIVKGGKKYTAAGVEIK